MRVRARRVLSLAMLAAASWYAMLASHEGGHILAALATGGTIEGVVLVPWSFSRTDLEHNPHPAFVAWAGPLFGSLLPALSMLLARLRRSDWLPAWTFFAGFCLIAYGAYLGAAAIQPVGDAYDLVKLGTPTWVVASAGIPPFVIGLWLWHRLGVRPTHRSADPDAR